MFMLCHREGPLEHWLNINWTISPTRPASRSSHLTVKKSIFADKDVQVNGWTAERASAVHRFELHSFVNGPFSSVPDVYNKKIYISLLWGDWGASHSTAFAAGEDMDARFENMSLWQSLDHRTSSALPVDSLQVDTQAHAGRGWVGRGTDASQISSRVFQRAQDMPGFDQFYTFQAIGKWQKHGHSSTAITVNSKHQSCPIWHALHPLIEWSMLQSFTFNGSKNLPNRQSPQLRWDNSGWMGALQVGMTVKSPEVSSGHDFNVW